MMNHQMLQPEQKMWTIFWIIVAWLLLSAFVGLVLGAMIRRGHVDFEPTVVPKKGRRPKFYKGLSPVVENITQQPRFDL
jgi:hypothetical protein